MSVRLRPGEQYSELYERVAIVLHDMLAVLEDLWYIWTLEFALFVLLTPGGFLLERLGGLLLCGLVYAVSRQDIAKQERGRNRP